MEASLMDSVTWEHLVAMGTFVVTLYVSHKVNSQKIDQLTKQVEKHEDEIDELSDISTKYVTIVDGLAANSARQAENYTEFSKTLATFGAILESSHKLHEQESRNIQKITHALEGLSLKVNELEVANRYFHEVPKKEKVK